MMEILKMLSTSRTINSRTGSFELKSKYSFTHFYYHSSLSINCSWLNKKLPFVPSHHLDFLHLLHPQKDHRHCADSEIQKALKFKIRSICALEFDQVGINLGEVKWQKHVYMITIPCFTRVIYKKKCLRV